VISVVVLTYNEETNIERCLKSVEFADDVLVLDSGSTDRTVELAQSMQARVAVRAFDSFANQRNFAMEQGGLRHPWVLHLDADEEVTSELREELLAIARASSATHDVWRVASRLMLHGQWLRHSGMYPAYQVRFGKRDIMRFVQHGHGQREAPESGAPGTLQAPLLHHNFSKGIADWLRRHVRYAEDEAAQASRDETSIASWRTIASPDVTARRRALKALSYRLPFRPMLRFCYVYFLRRGCLDGRAGYQYARMLATYESMIDCLRLEGALK
jgi:glycosyltransferase involved in cell wall biosynthesis